MLIASIARSNLSLLAQAKIDYILGLWQGQYPRQATIEHAAVWLDSINAKGPPFADVTNRYDFLEIFRFMHGVNIPYNPAGVQLEGLNAFLPIYERSADFLLDMAWKGLSATTPTTAKLEDTYCKVPPSASLRKTVSALSLAVILAPASAGTVNSSHSPSVEKASEGVHVAESNDGRGPAGVGSVLSLNFYLRMLIHLLGDIHQPLHTTLAFSPAFPDGDRFGSKIPVIGPKGRATNLHSFWDAAGDLYTKRAVDIRDEELLEEAESIMREFPKASVVSRLTPEYLAPNFRSMAEETNKLGVALAYREVDLHTFTPQFPYVPSGPYTRDVRQFSRSQIALAGYRLGHALEEISAFLPVPDILHSTSFQSAGRVNA
ncbi:hypothetical protein BESB_058570 [Besnoitia besnoiti]|uniref:S1/P1 nuclease n=1 Tax=Besnoitia besnoiti TaxID=94643 RepID=A0A2A9MHT3_BESBE|nr:hypothetical protein BESB_058570 [Besnoitia besnoiti]PFH34970.1 hypothetical protein BESB_058570 [Besnoitia besnoiti]